MDKATFIFEKYAGFVNTVIRNVETGIKNVPKWGGSAEVRASTLKNLNRAANSHGAYKAPTKRGATNLSNFDEVEYALLQKKRANSLKKLLGDPTTIRDNQRIVQNLTLEQRKLLNNFIKNKDTESALNMLI